MLVLGIDPGKQTGIAVVQDEYVAYTTRQTLEGEAGERYAQLYDFMDTFLWEMREGTYSKFREEYYIAVVCWEEPPRVKNTNTFRALCGYDAILALICEKLACSYLSANNRTIKKWFTGNGSATKDEVFAVAETKYVGSMKGEDAVAVGTEKVISQDEADAIMCAYYAMYVMTEGK